MKKKRDRGPLVQELFRRITRETIPYPALFQRTSEDAFSQEGKK